MHELSIVINIVEIAESEVEKHHAEKVESIELDIGNLSGIEPAALDFAWEQGVFKTVLEHSKLTINYIEGKAKCNDCGKSFKVETLYDECPYCDSFLKELIEGRDLKVKSLTII